MNATDIALNVENLLRPVVEGLGYELVDVQLVSDRGRRVLRLLVDRPGGITIDECVGISREVGPHLEVADPVRGAYSLEVSSPGIRRPLKRADDFQHYAGQQVVVRTREAIDGRKTFRGMNQGLDDRGNLVVLDRDTKTAHSIPLSLLREAHLDPEIRF